MQSLLTSKQYAGEILVWRNCTWSREGAAHGPTERLREKSLESLDSGPGEASGTEGGDGRTGDNSFSEPRLKVHLLKIMIRWNRLKVHLLEMFYDQMKWWFRQSPALSQLLPEGDRPQETQSTILLPAPEHRHRHYHHHRPSGSSSSSSSSLPAKTFNRPIFFHQLMMMSGMVKTDMMPMMIAMPQSYNPSAYILNSSFPAIACFDQKLRARRKWSIRLISADLHG